MPSLIVSHPVHEFLLGQSPMRVELSIQAVFRIRCKNLTSDDMALIVAFGTTKNGAPWCDAVAEAEINIDTGTSDDSSSVTKESENEDVLRSHRRKHQSGFLRQEFETIQKMFQAPLRETFQYPVDSHNPSNIPDAILSSMQIFEDKSDRAIKHLENITLRVAARRAFESEVSTSSFRPVRY
jgi:hypothetical protein